MATSNPEEIDVRAAAALAHRNPETVRRWVWSGRLAARRRGGRLFVARQDVEALLGRGAAAQLTLAEWARRARSGRTRGAASADSGSASDLVLEDRAQRSRRARS